MLANSYANSLVIMQMTGVMTFCARRGRLYDMMQLVAKDGRNWYDLAKYNCSTWIGEKLASGLYSDPNLDVTGLNEVNSPKKLLDLARGWGSTREGFAWER